MENLNKPLILNSSVLSVVFTVCIYYYPINKKNDYMQYILYGLEVSTCSLRSGKESILCVA